MQAENLSSSNLESLESKIDLEIRELGKIKSFEWIVSLRQKVKRREGGPRVCTCSSGSCRRKQTVKETGDNQRGKWNGCLQGKILDPDGFGRWLFMETTQALVFFSEIVSF